MKYATGEVIKSGDQVKIENGQTPAIVDLVIDSPELVKSFGVEEYGVLLKSEPFGCVFWSIEDNDELLFIQRGN